MIKVLKSLVVGPLEPYAAGFAAELERQGYTTWVAEKQVSLAAHLSRWLAASGAGPADLTTDLAKRYALARREAGYAGYLSVHALEPLLGYLRELGAVPAAQPPEPTPAQDLLGRFQVYLVSERGITPATAESYACFARPFAETWLAAGGPGLGGLTAADVTAFVVASCPGMPKGSAKMTVTSLRSLLAWLHVDGVLGQPLAWAVPEAGVHRSAASGCVPSLNHRKGTAITIVEDERAITGGVDTHADTHVAAALDPLGGGGCSACGSSRPLRPGTPACWTGWAGSGPSRWSASRVPAVTARAWPGTGRRGRQGRGGRPG